MRVEEKNGVSKLGGRSSQPESMEEVRRRVSQRENMEEVRRRVALSSVFSEEGGYLC